MGSRPSEILRLEGLYLAHGCHHGELARREQTKQLLKVTLTGHWATNAL